MGRGTGRAVAVSPAFWDASALVPLCTEQSNSDKAFELYRYHPFVVWWTTPVEIASALARLLRMGQLDATDWVEARAEAEDLARQWSVILPSDGLRSRAISLVNQYDLRAGDALQLAAAFEWREGDPRGHLFITADERLHRAAVLCGFKVEKI